MGGYLAETIDGPSLKNFLGRSSVKCVKLEKYKFFNLAK